MAKSFKKILSLALCMSLAICFISLLTAPKTGALAMQAPLCEDHIHGRCEKHDAKEATCTEDGYKEYYECSCGAFFEDSECERPIADLSAWKKASGKLSAGHIFGEWHEAFEGYCYENGTKAYKQCTVCKKYFDGNGKEIEDLATPPKGHTFSNELISSDKYHWHPSTCGHTTEVFGKEEHTYVNGQCTVCGHICAHDVIIEDRCDGCGKHYHYAKEVKEELPKLFKSGHKTYYACSCGKCYKDAEMKEEIADIAKWRASEGNISFIGYNLSNHTWITIAVIAEIIIVIAIIVCVVIICRKNKKKEQALWADGTDRSEPMKIQRKRIEEKYKMNYLEDVEEFKNKKRKK